MNIAFLNPFSRYFLAPTQEVARTTEHEFTQNSQGVSDDVDVFSQFMYQYGYANTGENGAEFNQTGIIFDQIFNDKFARVQKYRSMVFYPPVNKALNMVCDEAIVENAVGKIASFGMDENFQSTLKTVEIKQLETEFNYIMSTVFQAKDRMWELFKKWLVDGELFLEIVLSTDGKNVIGIKSLPPFLTFPVYNEGVLTGFFETVQTTSGSTEVRQFPVSQVAYANYGVFGRNKQDVRGYLETPIRPYNQLKSIEDALVVYRLTRAPEKRMWNIETGRMTPARAEEYVRKLMTKYKKRLSYDPDTGAINSSKNIQALTEDFWFPKTEGAGSTVETLQGGTSFIGQLEDVQLFKSQLYDAMLIPKSRWDDGSGATYTAGTDIAREEYNFGKFIKRLQKRFRKVIMDVFIQQLRVRGYDVKYLDRSLYDIQMCCNNFFEEYKVFQLNEQRSTVLNNFAQYMPSNENVNGPVKPIFSREYVLEEMMLLNDEARLKNKMLLAKEVADIKDEMAKNPAPTEEQGL